jgi:hypothetical protein
MIEYSNESFILIYFGLLIGFLLISLFLGRITVNPDSNYQAIFFGLIILTLLSGLLNTHGISVVWLFTPLLAWNIYKRKPLKRINFQDINPSILLDGIVLFIIFMYCSQFVYSFGSNNLVVPNEDFVSYSKIVQAMLDFQLESNLSYHQALFPKQIQPYHYFELWLTALLSQITNLPIPVLILSVVIPAIIFSIYKGFETIIVQLKFAKTGYAIKILAFVSLLFNIIPFAQFFQSGIYFIDESIYFNTSNFDVTHFNQLILKSFLLFLVSFIISRHKINALLVLFSLPIVTFLSIPIIVTSYFLAFIYFLNQKKNTYLVVVGTLLVLIGTYVVLSSANSFKCGFSTTVSLHVFIGDLINTLYYCGIPLLLFLILNFRVVKTYYQTRSIQILAITVSFLIIATATAHALTYNIPNSYQLFYPFVSIFFNLILVLLLLWLGNKNKYNYLLLIFFSGYNLFVCNDLFKMNRTSSYSNSYVYNILQFQAKNPIGLEFRDLKSKNIINRSPLFNNLGSYFIYHKNLRGTILGNPHDIEHQVSKLNDCVSDYYKANSILIKHNQTALNFALTNKSDFIIVDRHMQLPINFAPYYQLLYTDSLSLEKFYVKK